MKIYTTNLAIFIGILLPLLTKAQTPQQDPLASHIDYSVKAGDDFFDYANGKWFKQHPIPTSEQSNGIWQLIQDTINEQIKTICTSSAKLVNLQKGSNKQKIGDFYYSGMDSISLNKNGLSDLKPELAAIDKVNNLKSLFAEAAHIQMIAASPLLSIFVGQDDKISNKYAVFIHQGGISLPERSFYTDKDPKSKEIQKKYVEYVANIFEIMGYKKQKAQSAAVNLMEIETALAIASRKLEDTRDPFENYNKMSYRELQKLTPAIDWDVFTQGIGLAKIDSVIVGQPEFLTALNGYLAKYTLADWKNYLKFQLVNSLSPYLDDKTYMTNFAFYKTVLKGIPEPKARWKRVVGETDGSLGELIGQVYVSEYLPKGTKEKLQEIGNSIRTVFAERIQQLDWMSDATKQKALHKLNAITMKMGYPDEWKDMSSLQIDRNSFVKNVMNANKWGMSYTINKYGKPVNLKEWDMNPQTYNAYYNPSNNEIVIPGCNIIVPGFERKMADDAILYAIIGGSTIGHEITHGFDDQGSKYDEAGNLNNWWTPEDSSRFFSKTKMIVQQFDSYLAIDSIHINGEATQGENIADLGGVVMGLEAFKKTSQYKNNVMIADLSPSQRYFLGYALAWMVNIRPQALINQLKSDVHAPAKWRVLAPLSNMPAFYDAFGIKEGDAMWRSPEQRVVIW